MDTSARPLVVSITAAAGPLAYALLPHICSGQVFGETQRLILHLLDVSSSLELLRAVVMEIEDCAWPLVAGVLASDNPGICFREADVVFLAGVTHRKPLGMDQRRGAGPRTFREHAIALNQHAPKHAKIMVIAAPCDVNLMVCLRHAPAIPRQNFAAAHRLDRARLVALARRIVGSDVLAAGNHSIVVWGGHVPETTLVEFQPVLTAEGLSRPERAQLDELRAAVRSLLHTAAEREAADAPAWTSAAAAVADEMRLWWQGTSNIVSMLVPSDGSYDAPAGTAALMPVRCSGRQYQIVLGLAPSDEAREVVRASTRELQAEFGDTCAVLES